MPIARQINALANQIRRYDLFNQVPTHRQTRASEVQRTIRADWESYIGNPDFAR